MKDTGAIEVIACDGSHVFVPLSQLARAHMRRVVSNGDVVDQILAVCAERYGVTVRQIKSKSRRSQYVRPRHIGMYLARKMTTLSLPEIAARFLRTDHTTALYAVRKVEQAIDCGDISKFEINVLMDAVNPNGPRHELKSNIADVPTRHPHRLRSEPASVLSPTDAGSTNSNAEEMA